MIVTSVRLRLFRSGAVRVKAVGSIVLDQCFQIEHIHVVERENGTYLVAMPSRYESGKWHDDAHPVTPDLRQNINNSVMSQYWTLVNKQIPQTGSKQLSEGIGA